MAELDVQERTLLRRWEWQRARTAALWALPLLPLTLFAAWLARLNELSVCCALFLPLGAWWAFHRGGALSRAVLPGVVLGVVPLAAGLGARAWDGVHCCGHGCSSTCLPACVVAGLVAGLWVVRVVRHASAPPATAPLLAFVALTGALGCGCVGHAGALGMLGGLLMSSLPQLWWRPRFA